MVDDLLFQQKIFDLINGYLDIKNYRIPESELVQNEFLEGSPCNYAYGKVLDAYSSLCQRLHQDSGEDADIETIINEMNKICHHLCLKMFQYGVIFARRETK